MVRMRWLFILLLPLVFGCQRPGAGGKSKLVIQVPAAPGKPGAMAVLNPGTRKTCYAVAVSASDLKPQEINSCSPKFGLVQGFIEAGGTLSLEVPQGKARKIELFAHLQKEGDNLPCPSISAAFGPNEISRVYLIGSVPSVDLLEDEVTVTITATFPGLANHIAVGMPATCVAYEPTPTGPKLRVSSDVRTVMDVNGNRLRGRVGASVVK